MQGPYRLMVGTPAGADEVSQHENPLDALRERTRLRGEGPNHLRIYFVLSDDTDPPETGEVEWCNGCGDEACLASQDICELCEAEQTMEGV